MQPRTAQSRQEIIVLVGAQAVPAVAIAAMLRKPLVRICDPSSSKDLGVWDIEVLDFLLHAKLGNK